MSYNITEKLINFSDTSLKSPDYFVFVSDRRLLLFGHPSIQTSISSKYIIFYELWDLNQASIIMDGSIDSFGITYLCKFSFYKDNFVANIRTCNAEKSIFLLDFVKNEKIILKNEFSQEKNDPDSEILQNKLICFGETSVFVIFELIFFEKTVDFAEKKTLDSYFLLNFKVIQENNKNMSKFRLRREYDRQNMKEISVLKGNDEILVIFDYNIGEITVWNVKKIEDIRYFMVNFNDFIIKNVFFQNNDITTFICKEKEHKLIKLLTINLKENSCYMKNMMKLEDITLENPNSEFSRVKTLLFKKNSTYFVLFFLKFKEKQYKTYNLLYKSDDFLSFSLLNSSERSLENSFCFKSDGLSDYGFYLTQKNSITAMRLILIEKDI